MMVLPERRWRLWHRRIVDAARATLPARVQAPVEVAILRSLLPRSTALNTLVCVDIPGYRVYVPIYRVMARDVGHVVDLLAEYLERTKAEAKRDAATAR